MSENQSITSPLQTLSISAPALRKNCQILRSYKPQAQLWPCIKANAYGHGLAEVIQILESEVDGFCVVSTEEALLARQYTQKPIFVLNIVDPSHVQQCAERGIHLPLAQEEHCELYSQVNMPVLVHLEVDTGMARTGFRWKTVPEMQEFLDRLPTNIQIVGMFSHYAASGEDDVFSQKQFELFSQFVDFYQMHFEKLQYIHIDKSSSTLLSQYQWERNWSEMFRPGIATYGVGAITRTDARFQEVLRWSTKIISTRTIEAGEMVGYGLTFTADKKMKIATFPVGYADGFARSLSNKGYVLVAGQRCPIRGRICMNLTMVEVPDSVVVGDECVLIGKQGSENITLADVADWVGTTEYEVVSRLPLRTRQVHELL